MASDKLCFKQGIDQLFVITSFEGSPSCAKFGVEEVEDTWLELFMSCNLWVYFSELRVDLAV